ncbi:MAG: cell division protein FtsQ/DivIB [Acidimicrobiia bacterium]
MTPSRLRGRRPALYDQAADERGPAPPGRRGGAARRRRRAGALPPAAGPGGARPFDREAPPPAPPARLATHPRIRHRRIEVRRDEGRRRRRIVLACLATAALVGAAAGATRSPLLDVDRVEVRGAERTAPADVVAAGGLGSSPAMLDVDTASVERRVEALPWVLDASARRRWPATVVVQVAERHPAAVLAAGEGRWALADGTGRVLAVGPDRPAGLPVLDGVATPAEPGGAVGADARPLLAVAAALPAELRDRVAAVAGAADGEVELALAPPGGAVRLGAPVDLEEKLAVLATVMAKADLGRVAVIDVRVPRAPALTRR